MDFNFTDEQNMLRDSIAKLVQQKYDFDTRRKAIHSDLGWRPEIWAEMAEMGLMMAPLPESMGGLGGGAIDTLVIMEEFGKGLVVEPFIPSVVASGNLLRRVRGFMPSRPMSLRAAMTWRMCRLPQRKMVLAIS